MNKKPWRAGRDLETVIENVEILTGQRGDGSYAATTAQDLAALKLAQPRKTFSGKYTLTAGISPGIAGLEALFKEKPPQIPVTPAGFRASGAFSAVLLEWNNPDYSGHNLTEIWRSETDNLADAVLTGTSAGQVYSDPVNPGFAGYYWIRHLNGKNQPGPYSGLNGIRAQTTDTDAFFDKVETQISNSPLISDINTRGSRAFLDMWQQKTSAGNITAGIGIVAGTEPGGKPVSQVAISASQLFVYDPAQPDNKTFPFIVDRSRVVINELIAKDAIIKILRAQTIVADQVRAGISISTPTLRSASIQNGKFQVDVNGNMQARDAQLDNLTVRGIKAWDMTVNGLRANYGELNNVHILENCVIDGTISAARIIGDMAQIYLLGASLYLPPAPFNRQLVVLGNDSITRHKHEREAHGSGSIRSWTTTDRETQDITGTGVSMIKTYTDRVIPGRDYYGAAVFGITTFPFVALGTLPAGTPATLGSARTIKRSAGSGRYEKISVANIPVVLFVTRK